MENKNKDICKDTRNTNGEEKIDRSSNKKVCGIRTPDDEPSPKPPIDIEKKML